MDHVTDLRMEPRELAERWFRFLKVPAALLLNPAFAAQSDIHPGDLADLLARSGIDLIAERVENESKVVDLLDYDVRFGQGFLFSPPRPVRAEALQGAAAAAGEAAERTGRYRHRLTPRPDRPRRSIRVRLATLIPHFSTLAADYDVLLCDVWGVVHNGVTAFPHACDALMRARARGAAVILITNAPRPSDGGGAPARKAACAARNL